MALDIPTARLRSQLLEPVRKSSAKAVVKHFGAMQAQDYAMCKWAIGSRLPGSTDAEIEKALDSGEIVRTHVLRPTWHLAAADDIRWMLALTADNVLRQMSSTNRKLALDEKIFGKSCDIIANALQGGKSLTRQELMEILNRSGIETGQNRSLLIMLYAELKAIVCNGPRDGKNLTYALMDERIKPAKTLDREEALTRLADRYFTSHAPATLNDFAWWSGLSHADSKLAITLNGNKLMSREIGGRQYWAAGFHDMPDSKNILMLPAFDEFLIAYKDRSASVAAEQSSRAFTANGIFRPVVIKNGRVAGIWKRSVKKEKVKIEFEFFDKQKSDRAKLIAEAQRFSGFINKTPEIIF